MFPWISRLRARGGSVGMNEFYSFFRILLRNQSRRRNIHEVRVANKGFSIDEGQFFSFDHLVDALCSIATQSLQIKMLEQIQFLQKHVPARIGRRFIDGIAAIVGANRFFPAAPTSGQILCCQQASLRFAKADYSTGDLTVIERVGTAIDDRLESSAEVSLIENFPRLQRPPVTAKDCLRRLEFANHWIRGNRFG